jgi:hypothetical protein
MINQKMLESWMPIKITLDMHEEDFQKLLAAFKEGKLAEFGVTKLNLAAEEQEPGQKQWADPEQGKGGKRGRDSGPKQR